MNLADLYRQQGQDSDAERALHDGLARAPQGASAELQSAHGLTYIREKRTADALALQQLGRVAEARTVLAQALPQALPRHPDDRELRDAYVALVRPKAGP